VSFSPSRRALGSLSLVWRRPPVSSVNVQTPRTPLGGCVWSRHFFLESVDPVRADDNADDEIARPIHTRPLPRRRRHPCRSGVSREESARAPRADSVRGSPAGDKSTSTRVASRESLGDCRSSGSVAPGKRERRLRRPIRRMSRSLDHPSCRGRRRVASVVAATLPATLR